MHSSLCLTLEMLTAQRMQGRGPICIRYAGDNGMGERGRDGERTQEQTGDSARSQEARRAVRKARGETEPAEFRAVDVE